jgi:hypothetical protein
MFMIEIVKVVPQSGTPRANACAGRRVGTVRRGVLDHLLMADNQIADSVYEQIKQAHDRLD